MNRGRDYNTEKPRDRLFIKSSQITSGDNGTYTFADDTMAATVGDGSEVIVMDIPGMLLFYSADDGLLYDWSV